jgi:hypothetical protein
VSTRLIQTTDDSSFEWQRNYHDRIIRSDYELDRIRAYIEANPTSWNDDRNHPERLHDPSASLRHWSAPASAITTALLILAAI